MCKKTAALFSESRSVKEQFQSAAAAVSCLKKHFRVQ
jgi:hypothetical protein